MDHVRVGDVLRLRRRAVEVKIDEEYDEIGIRSFGRGIFHKERVSGASLGNKRVFSVEPGDLVISNVFAWEGAMALASKADAGRIGSHRFMTFVPVDHRIDASWAMWFFLSERGRELIGQASPGSAGRNRTLAIDRFEELEIPLPPINEQLRVAERINRVEGSASRLKALYERASEVEKALAVSSATRPDLSVDKRASSGWRTVRLADVLESACDVTPIDSTARYDIAGVYSFGRGMFERASLQGSQTSYKVLHRLHAGQLVMSRLKAWEGALAVVPVRLDGWFVSPEFPTFDIAIAEVDRDYLGALVTSEPFWAQLKQASQGIGARRQRVNASRLLDHVIELPPLSVQQKIARRLRSMATSAALRDDVLVRIQALVPAALNEAFAGLS